MDNYKDYACICCVYCAATFNLQEGEKFICTNENGRGCNNNPFQEACKEIIAEYEVQWGE